VHAAGLVATVGRTVAQPIRMVASITLSSSAGLVSQLDFTEGFSLVLGELFVAAGVALLLGDIVLLEQTEQLEERDNRVEEGLH